MKLPFKVETRDAEPQFIRKTEKLSSAILFAMYWLSSQETENKKDSLDIHEIKPVKINGKDSKLWNERVYVCTVYWTGQYQFSIYYPDKDSKLISL